ncbi:hypothetical protein ACHQM5_029340 [Ranunculus cassubicifolius]
MSSQTIEHIVLLKVKETADPSGITSLSTLSSLDCVLHLTVVPIHKYHPSSTFNFTHVVHGRYNTKQDLEAYLAHPDHVSAVENTVSPVCDDVMIVDWVTEHDTPLVQPSPGSAVRVCLLKLKEGVEESEKEKVLKIMAGVKDHVEGVEQITVGENFSPMAKGFTLASVLVFPGIEKLEGMDSNEEVSKEHEKVKDFVDSIIVLDYVV